MADDSDDQEKTEAATPRRLEKAREEGQVARSRELTTFLLLATGVATLWSMGGVLYSQLGLVMEKAFLFDRARAMDVAVMLAALRALGEHALLALLPLFLVMLVAALAAPSLLGGLVVSGKSLQPQFSRLNPAKGLKRIFSSQALAELAKVVAKALLVGSVGVWFVSSRAGEFLALMDQPVASALANALRLAASACGLMVLTLVVVILIDVPYQLWHHAKKLRMSREEIRREHKESEGDPHVKGRIRSQQQAAARRRMMSKVPNADVIVTNPSHYAVALRYDQARTAAPVVAAKGADAVAARIRELGASHGVPLLAAPPLARALYHHVDLDREIPADLYTAVAEVMVWAFAIRRGDSAVAAPSDLPVPEALANPPGRGET
ncbi:MAG: flagellar biosynthesis protein FlhB [Pseudomonas sp.]